MTTMCNGHNVAKLATLLAAPFHPDDIEWKPQQAGWKKVPEHLDPKKDGWEGPWVKLVAYITSRAIMARLDDVCGVDGWRNEFRQHFNGTLCGISLRIGDEWITKWDGAENTQIEAFKGGLSSAEKRAAVQWGIGRYLYEVEVTFGAIAADNDWNAKQVIPKGKGRNKDTDLKPFRWSPPRLPAWAQPGGSGKPGVVSEAQEQRAKAAVAALEATPPGDEVLPGTKAHFHGHGGKQLKNVPTHELKRAKEKLTEIGTEEYSFTIDAIAKVIATRGDK